MVLNSTVYLQKICAFYLLKVVWLRVRRGTCIKDLNAMYLLTVLRAVMLV